MNKKFLTPLLIVSSLLLANEVFAQEEQAFVGPGSCTSKEECRAYCDEDSHKEECLNFAVKNGMMSQDDANRALKFLNQTGPGGCKAEGCRTYCEDKSHSEECLNFAEENGLIGHEEVVRMRKFQAIETNGGPGGCKREECHAYCEDESHRDECFVFAKENGLIEEEEIKQYESGLKIREKIKESGGPGGCTSENECHKYCSDVSRVEECVAFGALHTGKSPEEIKDMLQNFRDHKNDVMEMRREPGFRPPEGMEDRFPQRPPTEEEMDRMKARYRENTEHYQGTIPPSGTMPDEMKMRMQQRPEGERMPYDNFRPENQTNPQYHPNQYPNMMPQEGMTPSNEDMMRPSEGMIQSSYPTDMQTTFPSSGEMMPTMSPTSDTTTTFSPPPSETYTPPIYSEPTSTSPPPEPVPTSPASYNHSKSFVANLISAFLIPFRK